MEKLLTSVWDVLSKQGLLGLAAFVFLAVIVLLVQDPERAVKIRAYILLPLYRTFKLASKQYIASRVASDATSFVGKEIGRQLTSVANTRIRVKWVTNPSDPILSRDGTLILRLEETNDQTRNIMAATRAALPRVVCPTARHNMQQELQTAIDMALLHKLANRLGRHAYPLFQSSRRAGFHGLCPWGNAYSPEGRRAKLEPV